GIDNSDTAYASSKLALEKDLATLTLDTVIIRPSFVYGKDCYGGSALFCGFEGTPGVIFLPGQGKQLLQPIHIHDLAQIIRDALLLPGKKLLYAVGPEQVSLKTILNKLRSWLGLKKAINIAIPMVFLRIVAKIGDWLPNAPLS